MEIYSSGIRRRICTCACISFIKHTRQHNSVHLHRGCDCRGTYIFCFYFSPALKLIFQSKAKRQTGLPTEVQNCSKNDRKTSFHQVQQVWRKQMTLSGRFYHTERKAKVSSGWNTEPFSSLYVQSRMDHNVSLLRVPCCRLVPIISKQSLPRKAVKQTGRKRRKLALLHTQIQCLYSPWVKCLDQHCVSSLCIAEERPYLSRILPLSPKHFAVGTLNSPRLLIAKSLVWNHVGKRS